LRKEISQSLLQESWVEEAVNLVETSKLAARDVEEFFLNELSVLIYDKSLSNHKRHERFMQLVEKCISSP
jgi:hypothetical protein